MQMKMTNRAPTTFRPSSLPALIGNTGFQLQKLLGLNVALEAYELAMRQRNISPIESIHIVTVLALESLRDEITAILPSVSIVGPDVNHLDVWKSIGDIRKNVEIEVGRKVEKLMQSLPAIPIAVTQPGRVQSALPLICSLYACRSWHLTSYEQNVEEIDVIFLASDKELRKLQPAESMLVTYADAVKGVSIRSATGGAILKWVRTPTFHAKPDDEKPTKLEMIRLPIVEMDAQPMVEAVPVEEVKPKRRKWRWYGWA